jgi:hypothetical protein
LGVYYNSLKKQVSKKKSREVRKITFDEDRKTKVKVKGTP